MKVRGSSPFGRMVIAGRIDPPSRDFLFVCLLRALRSTATDPLPQDHEAPGDRPPCTTCDGFTRIAKIPAFLWPGHDGLRIAALAHAYATNLTESKLA